MNTEDIIKVTIMEGAGFGDTDAVKASLAWDDSKYEAFSTNDFNDTEDAQRNAIGELWQEYGNDIIAYIRKKTIESMTPSVMLPKECKED
jgi:hypothetical protein